MEIGFIGLGNMGFPMACRILGENHDVIAFDTRSDALERVVALGAQTATSAIEVADRAETVMASLPRLLGGRDLSSTQPRSPARLPQPARHP